MSELEGSRAPARRATPVPLPAVPPTRLEPEPAVDHGALCRRQRRDVPPVVAVCPAAAYPRARNGFEPLSSTSGRRAISTLVEPPIPSSSFTGSPVARTKSSLVSSLFLACLRQREGAAGEIEDALGRIGPDVTRAAGDERALHAKLKGWKHRVYRGEDVARLLLWRPPGAARSRVAGCSVFRRIGAHWRPARCALEWTAAIRRAGGLDVADGRRGPGHILPDPAGGSASKRLMLFLRWMSGLPTAWISVSGTSDLAAPHPGGHAHPQARLEPRLHAAEERQLGGRRRDHRGAPALRCRRPGEIRLRTLSPRDAPALSFATGSGALRRVRHHRRVPSLDEGQLPRRVVARPTSCSCCRV